MSCMFRLKAKIYTKKIINTGATISVNYIIINTNDLNTIKGGLVVLDYDDTLV